MKRPAFQFYPADWRKDAALQSCSVGAQGLWINALCIAHECEPYGHLTVNGKAMTPAQIGRLVGLSAKECTALLTELQEAGVSSVAAEGAVFSRRMVRDEEFRETRATHGEKGKAFGHLGKEFGHLGAEHGVKGGRPRRSDGGIKPPPPDDYTGGSQPPPHSGYTGGLNPPQTLPPSSSSSSSSLNTEDMGSARKRASRTRFPDDFAPNDSGVKAATDAGLNVQVELQRFRDHHEATGSLMASWQAAWRTWVGKAVEFGHGKPMKATNGNTDWLVATGFPNIAEAQNCHCHIGNANLFRNGKRIGGES